MKIEYDESIDAAYIRIKDVVQKGEVKKTYPCDPLEIDGMINLDFDSEGRLLGIEIQDASKKLPVEVVKNLHDSK